MNCRVATMDPQIAAPYGAIKDAALGVVSGRLTYVGAASGLPDAAATCARRVVDLEGRWVSPGLIECHSHIIYGGQRAGEWELKLKGATYEEA